ncbi:MAG: hypothetical protein IPG97_14755 [Microthrixaceae bacterium]|nr:hypothetical protein [Microthrixaceae bacterium]
MSNPGPGPQPSDDPGYTDYGISFNVPAEEMYRPPLARPTGGPPIHAGVAAPAYVRKVKAHPEGTTILVLGILSIVVCPLIGPLAWSMGNKAMSQVRFSGYTYSNAGFIRAGRLLAIIATCLIVLWVIAVLVIASNISANGPPTTQP